MAVKIRLTRLGKKKQPTYRVVVMDSRKPRDGKYIEQLGFYDPRQTPSLIEINNERALHWLHTGAQPTERAQKLLEISGAWTQFKVAKGDIHTVADTPAVAEEPVVDSDDDGSRTTDDGAEAESELAAEASDETPVPADDDGSRMTDDGAPAESELAVEASDETTVSADDDGSRTTDDGAEAEASVEPEEVVEEVTADESSEEA
jgi:small subunit ribosomal protein S16